MIIQALNEFRFGTLGLTVEDFVEEGKVVQIGVPPVRIDIITSITGVQWEQAQLRSVDGFFGDLMVHYVGRDDFITNKKDLGRKKDMADLEAVGET